MSISSAPRVEDDRKGGDIDLYITTDMPTSAIIGRKIGLLVDMEKGLGEQKNRCHH